VLLIAFQNKMYRIKDDFIIMKGGNVCFIELVRSLESTVLKEQ